MEGCLLFTASEIRKTSGMQQVPRHTAFRYLLGFLCLMALAEKVATTYCLLVASAKSARHLLIRAPPLRIRLLAGPSLRPEILRLDRRCRMASFCWQRG